MIPRVRRPSRTVSRELRAESLELRGQIATSRER
jgi:hypothetical protein